MITAINTLVCSDDPAATRRFLSQVLGPPSSQSLQDRWKWSNHHFQVWVPDPDGGP